MDAPSATFEEQSLKMASSSNSIECLPLQTCSNCGQTQNETDDDEVIFLGTSKTSNKNKKEKNAKDKATKRAIPAEKVSKSQKRKAKEEHEEQEQEERPARKRATINRRLDPFHNVDYIPLPSAHCIIDLTESDSVELKANTAKIKNDKNNKNDPPNDNKDLKIQTTFVGGAELARRNAQKKKKKKKKKKSATATTTQSLNKPSPYECFFTSLLINPLHQIMESNLTEDKRMILIQEMCIRVQIPCPTILPLSYSNHHEFYSLRAALVLEEARFVLSEALLSTFQGQQGKHVSYHEDESCSMTRLPMKHGHSSRSNSSSSSTSLVQQGFTCILNSVGQPTNKQLLLLQLSANKSSSSSSSFIDQSQLEYYTKKAACIVLLSPTCNRDTRGVPNHLPSSSSYTSYILGCIDPTHRNDQLTISVYNIPHWNSVGDHSQAGSSWTITYLASLNKELRMFEVCMRKPVVSFMPSILGMKPNPSKAQHIRFKDDDDDSSTMKDDVKDKGKDGHEQSESNNSTIPDTTIDQKGDEKHPATKKSTIQTTTMEQACELTNGIHADEERKAAAKRDKVSDSICGNPPTMVHPIIIFPTLNPSQSRAAERFLQSSSGTITLVQGPPGTGKTTFMISVLFRYFFPHGVVTDKDLERLSSSFNRVVVTAPTNKAVTVIASRFLDAITNFHVFPLNLILIGVEDKLIEEEEDDNMRFASNGKGPVGKSESCTFSSDTSSPAKFKDIFIYTWLDTVVDAYRSLMNAFLCTCEINVTDALESILCRSKQYFARISRSIPNLSVKCGYKDQANTFHTAIEALSKSSNIADHMELVEISRRFQSIISCLETLNQNKGAVKDELLATANIIFCTLSTAGNSAMKHTRKINDLFVDEAAAATEAELCIPFQLYPSRMLAVGDPKQLPATIFSPHSRKYGLDKSLHERLMQNGAVGHIMLDVQYRMRPCISRFPSFQFYGNKLQNGANVTIQDYKGDISIRNGRPFSFLHVRGMDQQHHSRGSYFNVKEAEIVIQLVLEIRASAEKQGKRDSWYLPKSLRIITFYQGQVDCIRHLLRGRGLGNVLVCSVDSSQGCEADIVIVSFVRSNRDQNTGFLKDDRRLNVSLTRAKFQLFCIGDAKGTLRGSDTLKRLIDDATERNCLL